ncbi:unnamed protein product [Scytosiphon promiscuus]
MLLAGIVRRRCAVRTLARAAPTTICAANTNRSGGGRSSGGPLSRSSGGGCRPASTLPDVCGLPVVTSSWKAIKSLDEAYTEYANLSGDPYQRTLEALEHDPSCVLAHCLRGLLTALGQSDPAAVAACLADAERELQAAALLDTVASIGTGGGEQEEGERERVFTATLRAWSGGRWREGALYLETWLMSAPVDLPALKLAQDAHLTLGDAANMRDCVGRVLPFWSESMFGYGNVLGMHAFGLVENGSYALAEEKADMALTLESNDIWAVHAMAHVYEMEARASEGCSFLTDCRDQWEDKEGPLQQHMGWHLGLFSLERGQEARATRVFDTILAPPMEGGSLDGALVLRPPAPFALTDASSMLWRMDLLGLETGATRWRGVAEAWLYYQHARHLSTFHDLHALMAYVAMAKGVEDKTEADFWLARTRELVGSMEEYVRRGGRPLSPRRPPGDGAEAATGEAEAGASAAELQSSPLAGGPMAAAATPGARSVVNLHSFPVGRRRSAPGGNGADVGAVPPPPDNLWVAEHVGLALCSAIVAYRAGEFEEAVSLLLPLRHHLDAIGGSKAQQDVFHLTLQDAALRLPDQAVARTLVCERRLQRPTSGRAWEAFGTVMEREGRMREAFEARKMCFEFGIGQGGSGAN